MSKTFQENYFYLRDLVYIWEDLSKFLILEYLKHSTNITELKHPFSNKKHW